MKDIFRNIFVVAGMALPFICADVTFGQAAYTELPLEKTASGETSKAVGMLRNKEAYDVAIVERYVKNEMARLTAVKDVSNYAAIRGNLLLNIRSGESDQAKKKAADTVIYYAKGIAGSNNFHPASRINAMVALAELELASNQPYPGCYDPLLVSAKSEGMPLHLRAIALYGLNREIKAYGANMAAAKKQELSRDMAAIAGSQPKSPLDVKTHGWLVRRSFDVLSSMGATSAWSTAIARAVNEKELPSVRISAIEYLSKLDLTPLPDDKKKEYFLGVSQLIEQELVRWYSREDDLIKAKSGAASGSYGMPGMGDTGGSMGSEMMGGYGDAPSSMGSDYGSPDMAYGGAGSGGAPPKKKAIDTQTWDVRIARRNINQIAQIIHVALDGKPLKDARPMSTAAKSLAEIKLPAEYEKPFTSLVEAVENLQSLVNDSAKVTNINSLLNQAEAPIETIMDLVRELPEFKTKYPNYKDGDELSTVEEEKPQAAPAEGGADPASDADPGAAEGAGAAAAAPAR